MVKLQAVQIDTQSKLCWDDEQSCINLATQIWRILNNSGKFVQMNDQLDYWFVREMINNPLRDNKALLMTASDQIVSNYHELADEHTSALLDGTSAQLDLYYRINIGDRDSYGLFITTEEA